MKNLKYTAKPVECTGLVIKSKTDYTKIMAEIERLMAKGSKNVSTAELAKIGRLALVAQACEKKIFKN